MLSWLFCKRRRTTRRILMYTRDGCHLCEEAHARLQAARRQHGFVLEIVDVDVDPGLVALYGDCVPVVLIDGKVRFRGQVNPVLLDRLLRK